MAREGRRKRWRDDKGRVTSVRTKKRVHKEEKSSLSEREHE